MSLRRMESSDIPVFGILRPNPALKTINNHQCLIHFFDIQQPWVDLVYFIKLHPALFKITVGEVYQNVFFHQSWDSTFVKGGCFVWHYLTTVRVLKMEVTWGTNKHKHIGGGEKRKGNWESGFLKKSNFCVSQDDEKFRGSSRGWYFLLDTKSWLSLFSFSLWRTFAYVHQKPSVKLRVYEKGGELWTYFFV